jgi:hypothetical protein
VHTAVTVRSGSSLLSPGLLRWLLIEGGEMSVRQVERVVSRMFKTVPDVD